MFIESLKSDLGIVPEVQVPVYFVQGKYDFNTPTHLARDYYDGLTARQGKYWLEFEDAAHFPFYEAPTDFLGVLKRATNN